MRPPSRAASETPLHPIQSAPAHFCAQCDPRHCSAALRPHPTRSRELMALADSSSVAKNCFSTPPSLDLDCQGGRLVPLKKNAVGSPIATPDIPESIVCCPSQSKIPVSDRPDRGRSCSSSCKR